MNLYQQTLCLGAREAWGIVGNPGLVSPPKAFLYLHRLSILSILVFHLFA